MEVAAAKAEVDASLAEYRQAFLLALGQAENALVAITAYRERGASLDEAIDGLRGQDVYPGGAEVVRYFFYRYEEHLARKAGQVLNESQWNRIWADEPAC